MAAQYELLKELLNSGTKLNFGQEFFFKFYQAFLLKDRWLQYVGGVGTTLLVTALALALGIVLGSVVALVRVAHDQQRPGHKNPVLGFFNMICEIYTTIIRGTPMMVQLLIMSMVIFANSRNFTMVGALALGINSGAYVAEIVRGGLNGVSKGQFEAGYAQGFNTAEVLLYIVLPQAYRNIVPTLLSQVITTIKDSSYLANVATIELMARIRQLLSAAGTYNGLGTVNVSDVMVLFGTACVIYFIINFTLSCVVRAMQNRRRKALVFAPAKAA